MPVFREFINLKNHNSEIHDKGNLLNEREKTVFYYVGNIARDISGITRKSTAENPIGAADFLTERERTVWEAGKWHKLCYICWYLLTGDGLTEVTGSLWDDCRRMLIYS